jgi:hypothetical protein
VLKSQRSFQHPLSSHPPKIHATESTRVTLCALIPWFGIVPHTGALLQYICTVGAISVSLECGRCGNNLTRAELDGRCGVAPFGWVVEPCPCACGVARPLREARADSPDRLALCVNALLALPSLTCSLSASQLPFPPPLLPSPRMDVESLTDRDCTSGRSVADATCLGPDGFVVFWPVVFAFTAPVLEVDVVCA